LHILILNESPFYRIRLFPNKKNFPASRRSPPKTFTIRRFFCFFAEEPQDLVVSKMPAENS